MFLNFYTMIALKQKCTFWTFYRYKIAATYAATIVLSLMIYYNSFLGTKSETKSDERERNVSWNFEQDYNFGPIANRERNFEPQHDCATRGGQ